MPAGRLKLYVLSVAALCALSTVPTVSQSSLTVYVWRDAASQMTHQWWPAGSIEGDAAVLPQIDRVDIYARREGFLTEQPYFLGSATPIATDATHAVFSLGWQATPPVGWYRFEARAHNSVTDTYTSGDTPDATHSSATYAPPYYVIDGKTDFVGNSNPDLLLYENTGRMKIWMMSGHHVAQEVYYTGDYYPQSIPDGWRIVGTGDWRQDERLPMLASTGGGPDLLLQHDGGWLWIWAVDRNDRTHINTTMLVDPAHLGDPLWRVEATADMNRDTWPDLIVRHQATGDWRIKYMRYNRITSSGTPDPDRLQDTNWKIVGAADFNHDMWPDVVWQHQTQGWVLVLLMNGTNMLSSDFINPARMSDTNWKVRAVVDLNNDSWPDLVWQHDVTNLSQIWFMRGLQLVDSEWLSAGGYGATVPAGWSFVGPK